MLGREHLRLDFRIEFDGLHLVPGFVGMDTEGDQKDHQDY